MTFSFKRKHLVMVSVLAGSLASGSLQASDNMPFSFEDVDHAYTNGTTLDYKESQYTVGNCFGDGSRSSSTSLIPEYLSSAYGNSIYIMEDFHDDCEIHRTPGNGLLDCGPEG